MHGSVPDLRSRCAAAETSSETARAARWQRSPQLPFRSLTAPFPLASVRVGGARWWTWLVEHGRGDDARPAGQCFPATRTHGAGTARRRAWRGPTALASDSGGATKRSCSIPGGCWQGRSPSSASSVLVAAGGSIPAEGDSERTPGTARRSAASATGEHSTASHSSDHDARRGRW
jgi:hypothetical protein